MNHIDLKGRTVVVTGGAKEIGYAIAERALRSGATVALWDRDEARAQHNREVLSELGAVTRRRGVPGWTLQSLSLAKKGEAGDPPGSSQIFSALRPEPAPCRSCGRRSYSGMLAGRFPVLR